MGSSFVPLGKGDAAPSVLRQGVARLPQTPYGPLSQGGQEGSYPSGVGGRLPAVNALLATVVFPR
jgi:hypothetical protein